MMHGGIEEGEVMYGRSIVQGRGYSKHRNPLSCRDYGFKCVEESVQECTLAALILPLNVPILDCLLLQCCCAKAGIVYAA